MFLRQAAVHVRHLAEHGSGTRGHRWRVMGDDMMLCWKEHGLPMPTAPWPRNWMFLGNWSFQGTIWPLEWIMGNPSLQSP